MSADDHEGLTSLEPLNRKPVLWRGLTSDELGLMLGICVGGSTVIFLVVIGILWSWVVGLLVGLLFGMGVFLLASGFIEKQKKKHGSAQFWIYMKKTLQKKGFGSFGYETEKKKWGPSLTQKRRVHPRIKQ